MAYRPHVLETLFGGSNYPLTTDFNVSPARFVVSMVVGEAPYNTIQSGMDAANLAGGGVVYVMPNPASYVEDLILYENVSILGSTGNSDVPNTGNTVTIEGSHTPPSSGYVSIKNCYLRHATSIILGVGAGTAIVVLGNCVIEVTNGYTWDMPNWVAPGAMIGFNNQTVQGTNNGVINNPDQATTYLQDSVSGSGTGNSMIISGIVTLKSCDFMCPVEFRKNTIENIDNCRFGETVSATINATGIINFSRFDPLSNGPAFVMNSTDPIRLSNCVFNTPNNPCIDGAGAGLLTLTSATFIDNALIAGTVNIAAASAFLPASFGTAGEVFTSNGLGVVPSFSTSTGITAVGNLGNQLNTTRCAFLATSAADQLDVTGDGTDYTVTFDTEIFDQGNNFAANTFTAPVTGLYQFFFGLSVFDFDPASISDFIGITTTLATYRFYQINIPATASNGNYIQLTGSIFTNMNATNTAQIHLFMGGGAKTSDIIGTTNAGFRSTFFSGYLVF